MESDYLKSDRQESGDSNHRHRAVGADASTGLLAVRMVGSSTRERNSSETGRQSATDYFKKDVDLSIPKIIHLIPRG